MSGAQPLPLALALALPLPYSIKRHGVTLTNCDDEPVQTPGCIQAHGLLLALRLPDLVVAQVSENCAPWTGLAPAQVLGLNLADVVGAAAAGRLCDLLRTEALDDNPCYALTARLPGAAAHLPALDMSLHTADGVLLLEMEPSGRGAPDGEPQGDYLALVKQTISRLKNTQTLAEFCAVVAREARGITGLDRAMVYQFHADDSGEVMADARREDLPSWLGLRYPAADIPRPAREIFKRIGVRPLPDVQGELCEMVPLLNPDTGRPLQMTHCALRGASVMYTEYLQNMGVAATLTMPILRDGALWGLIACHHQTPRALAYPLRSAAEFLAQIASLEIAQAEQREHLQYRVHLDAVHLAVLSQAAGDGLLVADGGRAPGLTGLLEGIRADGVAVFQGGRWQRAGQTPDEAQLGPLAAWLRERIERSPDGLQTCALDALGAAYAPAQAYAAVASGVLATAVSRHADSALALWFRGEQLQTYNWAGNPHEKPTVFGAQGPRLTPRRSFDLWQEQVRGHSRPWLRMEVEAVQRLRRLWLDLVVLGADKLAQLNAELAVANAELATANADLALSNAELARSNGELDAFAYIAGHDLKEPLRGISRYAHRLLEDAQAGRVHDASHLAWLLRLTGRMDALLDALLHYSRVGRLSLDFSRTDLGPVLVEAMEMLGGRLAESHTEVRLPRPLPEAWCDRMRVREILSNLISNALKYNDRPDAWIEIGHIAAAGARPAEDRPASTPPQALNEVLFYVRDNGIGIEERHRDSVFAIFKRLHAHDVYGGGSGVGLTIARKLVEQHQGSLWFDSQPGVGSTFYFTLPGTAARLRAGHDH